MKDFRAISVAFFRNDFDRNPQLIADAAGEKNGEKKAVDGIVWKSAAECTRFVARGTIYGEIVKIWGARGSAAEGGARAVAPPSGGGNRPLRGASPRSGRHGAARYGGSRLVREQQPPPEGGGWRSFAAFGGEATADLKCTACRRQFIREL
ncbi:MAG TPA: hypothetical protein VGR95_12910 [Thermoanaerobaculia bacterium]|nr:hypothetical protein [Thermoanaerobaculia bacterium]